MAKHHGYPKKLRQQRESNSDQKEQQKQEEEEEEEEEEEGEEGEEEEEEEEEEENHIVDFLNEIWSIFVISWPNQCHSCIIWFVDVMSGFISMNPLHLVLGHMTRTSEITFHK